MRRFLMVVSICVLGPAGVAAAASTVSGNFKGKTSQGKPFVIKVESGFLHNASVQWTATCTSPLTTLSGKTVLNGNTYRGRYKQRVVYTVQVKKGMKAKHTAKAQFTIKNHRLNGSFQLVAVVRNSQGVVTTTCSTPTITFSAGR
jgi:hypothetical protein